MDGQFFVQVVRDDGSLGQLFGPATWDEAIAKVKAYVQLKGPSGESQAEAFERVEMDGAYDWGGEGITIIQADPIESPFGEFDVEEDENNELDDYTVELRNGGSMEFDPSDGTIRYNDCDGNCENIWKTDDPEYDNWKSQYFPDAEVDPDDEDEELRRDEKNGLYGGQVDPAN